MAPEVIACDENPDATYDYRVRVSCLQKKNKNKTQNQTKRKQTKPKTLHLQYEHPWKRAVFETFYIL